VKLEVSVLVVYEFLIELSFLVTSTKAFAFGYWREMQCHDDLTAKVIPTRLVIHIGLLSITTVT
jgi:hypothetical protein